MSLIIVGTDGSQDAEAAVLQGIGLLGSGRLPF
jgi:hypothetical protein